MNPKPKLCECDCGMVLPLATYTDRANGYIKGEPRRFIIGHQSRGRILGQRRKGLIDERYFNIKDMGFRTHCWVWFRSNVGKKGYGSVWSPQRRKKMVAHIAVWEERIGPWPEGMQADHLCRITACVNPDHIEPVTQSVNQRRGLNNKLSDDDRVKIGQRYYSGQSVRGLAREFKVTRDTIKRTLGIGGRYGPRHED